jgi:hypothetical protein
MFNKTLFVGVAIGILIAILVPAIPSKIKTTTGI